MLYPIKNIMLSLKYIVRIHIINLLNFHEHFLIFIYYQANRS